MDALRRKEASRRNGRLGGRPKGTGHLKKPNLAVRWTKEVAREAVRQQVTAQLRPLVNAQIANALGLKYLVTRDKKTGKFVRVTEAMARVKQHSTEETIEVWEKDPSVHAFTDLLNRALDKPTEHHELVADVTLEERKRRLRTALTRVRADEERSHARREL